MERLTTRIKDGDFYTSVIDNNRDDMDNYVMACERLADYEDTGLTPEQIREMKEENEWIPVKKAPPPFGMRLQATILHHEWITDYDCAWVPDEEKVHHESYTEVCEIYPMGAMWCYACAEDDYHSDIAYIEPAKNISRPVAEIIAWRPLPDLYQLVEN